jgi:hypothetical protein
MLALLFLVAMTVCLYDFVGADAGADAGEAAAAACGRLM